MQVQLGAHELIEINEVLSCMVNSINQFQIYKPYCQDQELKNILENQLSFMTNEYNSIVITLQQKTSKNQLPNVEQRMDVTPIYGVNKNTVPEAPNASINQLNDRDISSTMNGSHKALAVLKMQAALECTDSQIREMMIQSSKNCADQAYETWTYMNKKGYYQVPVFDQAISKSMINGFQQSSL